MRIIGVLDIAHGFAVHACGGQRDRYMRVEQVAAAPVPAGDAAAIASAYRDRLGIDELYVADLGAIAGMDLQDELVASIAHVAPVWLDAGITSVEAAGHAVDAGAAGVVVGLETLTSFEALEQISISIGHERTVFSLDLRDGRLLQRMPDLPADTLPCAIARRAAQAGVATIVVIDLARVGTGRGPDLELMSRVREDVPDVVLIAGGGIGGVDDLMRLAAAGCDGVLIATALHDGRITADDIAAARSSGAAIRGRT